MTVARRDFLTGVLAAGVTRTLASRPAFAQARTVRIGSAVLGDYAIIAPVAVALEKGFFKESGIQPEFTPFQGGPDLLKAVQAGHIDIGITGSTDVFVFREAGVPVRAIASTVDGNNWTLNVAPAVTKLGDLKGKTIGVTRVGSATWVLAVMLARRQGWDPERDVKIVGLGGLDALAAALIRGEIQAFVFGDGGAVTEKQGRSKILVRFDSILPRWISQFAYCTDEYTRSAKDPIRRTLRGFFQAMKFLRESPQEGARIAMKTLTWSEPAALRAHEISGPVFSRDGRIDVETLRSMQNTLLELAVLKKRLPLEDHFTQEFTPVRL